MVVCFSIQRDPEKRLLHGGLKMKKFLLLTTVAAGITGISSAGMAADLPVRTPAPVPVPPPFVFSWTGFYLGGNIGGAWAQRNVTDTVGRNFSNTSNGVFIGG